MKRITGILAAVTALLIISCDIFLGPDKPVGAGNLVIGFGESGGLAAAGRATVPSEEELANLRYDLVLTGPEGQPIERSVSAGESFNEQVSLGEWHIEARAYNPANVLIGTGSTDVTVRAGKNEAWVPIEPVAETPPEDTPVNALNLASYVTAPVIGQTPDTTAIDAAQYTGTIAWQKEDGSSFSGNFAAATVYKAVVTLSAKTGFAFTGVAANSFSHSGATTVTNAADSGTVTITFPATAALANVTTLNGTAGDTQITLTWIDPAEGGLDHIEISWTAGGGGNATANKSSAGNRANSTTITGLSNGTAYIFTVKAVDTAGNKSGGVSSASLKPLAPTGTGVVRVEFTGLPRDETIDLSGVEDLSWKANTTLTVSVTGGFTAHRWYLDGDALTGEISVLSLNGGDLAVKKHTLTVFVTEEGGAEYAKTVSFTVTP